MRCSAVQSRFSDRPSSDRSGALAERERFLKSEMSLDWGYNIYSEPKVKSGHAVSRTSPVAPGCSWARTSRMVVVEHMGCRPVHRSRAVLSHPDEALGLRGSAEMRERSRVAVQKRRSDLAAGTPREVAPFTRPLPAAASTLAAPRISTRSHVDSRDPSDRDRRLGHVRELVLDQWTCCQRVASVPRAGSRATRARARAVPAGLDSG